MTEPIAPVKKKRVNSKKKGSGFEGHIGKVLAEALPPLKFRRSQSSGAILGGLNARFMEQFSDDAKALFVGDVVPTNESDVFRDEGWRFRFTLECKFYKTPPNLEHLFASDQIRQWFEQATTDAAKLNKEPLLIFKYNHTDVFCGCRAQVARPEPVVKELVFNELGPAPRQAIVIFKFKDAILDTEWWKVRA